MLSTYYYVKIFPNKIVARNLSSGRTAQVVPETPYLHPRLLIGNITAAEIALTKALSQVKSSNPLKAIRILIHPIAEFPGGISEGEERLFRQLAYDSLAGQVVFWAGPDLSDDQVVEKIKHGK